MLCIWIRKKIARRFSTTIIHHLLLIIHFISGIQIIQSLYAVHSTAVIWILTNSRYVINDSICASHSICCLSATRIHIISSLTEGKIYRFYDSKNIEQTLVCISTEILSLTWQNHIIYIHTEQRNVCLFW